MIQRAMSHLALNKVELLFIENVGNLVCPASYELGEHLRIVLGSTTEGEDKPLKYPAMFRKSDAFVINKLDLLPYLSYDMKEARALALRVNPALEIFETSCTTGQGIQDFSRWIIEQMGDTSAA